MRVAEALNRITPGSHEKRTALFNSGAEAVENAVKIARAATGRQAVVAFDHAYHGRTNLTMAMTAKNMPYKHGFGPFAAEVYRAPMSYPFRDAGVDGPAAARRAIDVIDKQVGAANLAAVVIEPIQGEGGFVVPAPGFLPALAEWCRAQGVVFVADEVQTGFARTGDLFACDHEGVVPDLIATAKGIAGGLPLAAVTGRAEIMDAPTSAASAAPTAATPRLRRRAGGDRGDRDRGVRRPGAAAGQDPARPAHRPAGPGPPHRRRPRPRRDGRRRAGPPRHHRPRPRAHPARGAGGLRPGPRGPHLRHLGQRPPPPPPLAMPDHLLTEALDVLVGVFGEV